MILRLYKLELPIIVLNSYAIEKEAIKLQIKEKNTLFIENHAWFRLIIFIKKIICLLK